MNTNELLPSPNLVRQLLRSRKMRQKKASRLTDPHSPRHLRFEALEDRRVLALIVNTTADGTDLVPGDGQCDVDPNPSQTLCTLRAAIQEANSPGGPDTITFNIPISDPFHNGQWAAIQVLLGPLPPLTDDGITINGFSQPNSNPGVVGTGGTVGVDQVPLPQYQKPEIAIDANGQLTGLVIDGNANNITIQGIAVYDSTDVAILGAAGVGTNRVVQETFIGVKPDGTDPLAESNKGFGGRQLSPGQLTVTRSFVGHNGQGGLDGEASKSVVVFTYNEVFDNGRLSQDHDGIDVNGINSIVKFNLARDNTKLTPLPSGNAGNGIELGSQSAGTGGNLVENNTSHGNLSAGISDRKGASLNLIQKNVIFNNQVGISVNIEGRMPTHRNELSQNSIYMNMGLGIDLQVTQNPIPTGETDPVTGLPILEPGPWVGFASVPLGTGVGPDGVTPNDHCDADEGSNNLQNFPELSSAVTFGNTTQVSGTLNSTASTTFTIEFFSTPIFDMFGVGDREGRFFLGAIQVTTGVNCIATFNNANLATAVPEDHVITATATQFDADQPNSTSEFSGPITVNQVDLSGKVTGGGWYIQPAAAIPAGDGDDTANFGFNAMYRNKTTPEGTPIPEGKTNFVFRERNIHFLSTSYSPASLVVTGGEQEPQKARWRGLGWLNQQTTFGFEVNLTDNGEPGSADTWRIHIWRDLDNNAFTEDDAGARYENGSDLSETILNGGNLQVHMRPNALEFSGTMNVDWGNLRAVYEEMRLSQEALDDTVAHAIDQWRAAGVDETQLTNLANLQVRAADLPDGLLGLATPGQVTIDATAAGYGWFVETMPSNSTEFHSTGAVGQMALDQSAAFGRFDLLTAVTHELGHHLGLGHSHENNVMHATLSPGLRVLPEMEKEHGHHEHNAVQNQQHELMPARLVLELDANAISSRMSQVLVFSNPMNASALTWNWSIGRSTTFTAIDRLFSQTMNWRSDRVTDESSRQDDLLSTLRDNIVDRRMSDLVEAVPHDLDLRNLREATPKLLDESFDPNDREIVAERQLAAELIADVQERLLSQLHDMQSYAIDPQDAAPDETADVASEKTEQATDETRTEASITELTPTEAELEQWMIDLLDNGEDQVAAVDVVHAEAAL